MQKKFIIAIMATVASLCSLAFSFAPSEAQAVVCKPVQIEGITLTAKLVNPTKVTGNIDGSGCDIAVYVGPGVTTTLSNGTISNLKYKGVFVDGGTLTMLHIKMIGSPTMNTEGITTMNTTHITLDHVTLKGMSIGIEIEGQSQLSSKQSSVSGSGIGLDMNGSQADTASVSSAISSGDSFTQNTEGITVNSNNYLFLDKGNLVGNMQDAITNQGYTQLTNSTFVNNGQPSKIAAVVTLDNGLTDIATTNISNNYGGLVAVGNSATVHLLNGAYVCHNTQFNAQTGSNGQILKYSDAILC